MSTKKQSKKAVEEVKVEAIEPIKLSTKMKEIPIVKEEDYDKDELVNPTDLDVYFGNGEFAITKKNIDKLRLAVIEYNATNNWSWKLQDCLGINKNGKLSKKFSDIIATLHTVKISEVQALIAEMQKVTEKKPEDVIYTPSKLNPEQKEARDAAKAQRRTEVEALLNKVTGLTQNEISKMVKAI